MSRLHHRFCIGAAHHKIVAEKKQEYFVVHHTPVQKEARASSRVRIQG
jgi:hypothetical protein